MRELDPGTPEFEAMQRSVKLRLRQYLDDPCFHCARKMSLTAVASALNPPVDKSGLWRFITYDETFVVWPTLVQLHEFLKERKF